MTILSGEHYVVETLDQFCQRTKFDHHQVATSLRNGTYGEQYDIDGFLLDMDEIYRSETGESVDSIKDLREDDVREMLGALNVSTLHAIIDTLEQDDRDWIHLYNGTTHDIVEVYDE